MIWIHADEQTDVPGPCAVTIGKFDGLHLGHRLLLSAIRDKAQKEGMKTVVIAVSPSNMSADRENLQLLTDRERAALLTEWGIDWLADLDFTEETRRMSAERFVRDVLVSRFHAAYLAVGEDFCFGYERRGTPAFLAQLSASCGYTVETFPKVSWNGEEISSTRIREAVRYGCLEKAYGMLGRPYSIEGIVRHGKALGRTLGFPTLNIVPPPQKILPPNGVFFSRTWIDGEPVCGLANLGIQPTAAVHSFLLEVHLLDYERDLYGKTLKTELLHYVRPERQFGSLSELKEQLMLDRKSCGSFFEKTL